MSGNDRVRLDKLGSCEPYGNDLHNAEARDGVSRLGVSWANATVPSYAVSRPFINT
jgi:hypothetical protein